MISEAKQTLNNMLNTDLEQFRDWLSSFIILDLGTARGYSIYEGRVDVALFRVEAGEQVVIPNVEVLYAGGMTSSPVNSLGLVVFPRTPMADTFVNATSAGNPDYSFPGAKFIPLSNGRNAPVNAGISADMSFVLSSEFHRFCFREDSLSYVFNDGKLSFNVYLDGTYSLSYGTFSYTTTTDKDNNILKIQYSSDREDILNMYQIKSDGTIVHYINAKTSDIDLDQSIPTDKWKRIVTTNPDGTYSDDISQGAMNLSTSVDGDGNYSISININGTTLDIDKDGKVSLTLGSDLEIDGSSSNYNIAIKNVGKFSVNDSDLEVT